MTPGQRLGPYEIVALLGQGGMGEVYRARDTRLNRDIAIKTSREEFSDRFQREAQAVAALNHPNICHLYDVGPNYLVMELVEGETLHGSLPIDDALKIASQIADALEAAHEKGVVHRDLKPANIKITPNGVVKVLDFGLARRDVPESEDPSESPTAIGSPTSVGMILGTAAYMAPEQARGKVVDKRADIWAFGVVLYETLTGKQLFAGETVTDVLAGVLTKKPDFGLVPVKVRRLLQSCLEKDPKRRLRDIGDWRQLLDEGSAAVETRGSSNLRWAMAGALAAALTAIAVLSFRTAPASAPEIRTEINTPPTSDPYSIALSLDGRRIAFVATSDGQQMLWVRELDSGVARPLTGTEGVRAPFWSPDSRSIGFFAQGKLKRVDVVGGVPQTLADTEVITAAGGAWSPDGVIAFTISGLATPLYRVSAFGGRAAQLTKVLEGQSAHLSPRFLPDGRHFLYYASGTEPGIWLGSLNGDPVKRITAADSAGEYLAPGWLLWVQQNSLVAQRFDIKRAELAGDPVTLAQSVGFNGISFSGAFSVSTAGLIAYRAGSASRRQLVWFNRAGGMDGAIGAPDDGNLNYPELSPDGKRVVVTRGSLGAGDIWLLDGERATRFTFDPHDDRWPIWSPDGSRVVFSSNRKGSVDIYQKLADASVAEELLLHSPDFKRPSDWSPDGRFILYWSLQNHGDLMLLPLTGDRKPYPFLGTSASELQGQFAPDGKWVAYQSNASGRYEIYVRPFPGPGGQWQISMGGGTSPRWSRNGKELYYISPDLKMMSLSVVVGGVALEQGIPAALFQTHIYNGPIRQQYDVAPDGRFLINTELQDTAAPITLLQNWKPPK